MFTIIYLYILVICLGIVAYFSLDRKCDRTTVLIGSLLLFLFLLLFATFRNGDVLPDYQAYCKMFASQTESKTVEQSFYFINTVSNSLCQNNVLVLFFIYALLGITTKYYAIRKYSTYQPFSIFVWCCSFYLLEDMIQIRASVAGGLLMLLIPRIAQRKWHFAVLLFLLAFTFHNSAIVFLVVFFLNPFRINVKFWFIGYLLALFVNILNVDFYGIINFLLRLIPSDFVSSRFYIYIMRDYYNVGGRVTMYSPYTLLQTIVCLFLLWRVNFIKEVSPYVIIWLKVGFISLYIYSLSIPGVTMRLSELLSVVHVFLMPLLIDAVPYRYRYYGGVSVIILGLLILSNFIFFQHFVYL